MKRILIIEDDDLMRTIIATMLKRAGYETVMAANGIEGLLVFRSSPADLVITDLLMPEKDGLETIRELHGEFPDVPIIAMSAGSQLTALSFLPVAMRLGAKYLLPKPFDKDFLLKTVAEALNPPCSPAVPYPPV